MFSNKWPTKQTTYYT